MIYLLHVANDPERTAQLVDGVYDSLQVSDTVWLLSTEKDIDTVDNWCDEHIPATGPVVLLELSGDFSMQGLDEPVMQWIDERSSQA
jgi:hypothetical protein